MCACAISLHINVITFFYCLITHIIVFNVKLLQFYEITYNDSMCTHIQVFDSVLSENLLLQLHLDTLHNMVKLGFHYLFLLVFYHMMHIYIALHLQNLIHVLSIVIQQNCEVIVYFVVHFTYMFLPMSVTTHSCKFCCSCMWQLLHM